MVALFKKRETKRDVYPVLRDWVWAKVEELNLPHAVEANDSITAFGWVPTFRYNEREICHISIEAKPVVGGGARLSITAGECNRHTILAEYDASGEFINGGSSGHSGSAAQNTFSLVWIGLPKRLAAL